MASYGARSLVLATSSPSRASESGDLLQQLSSYGCNASVEVCDVGDFAAVERLVASIETPIGGVIHSALRLSVGLLSNLMMLSSTYLTLLTRTGFSRILLWKISTWYLAPRSMVP